jgi:hypothetical protein
MSDSDSFIDEVTEEVRRDRLFLLLRKYGWIAIVLIIGIVGGAAYNEYSKSRARIAAEQLGDGIIAALANNAAGDRAARLADLEAKSAGGDAVLGFLLAAAQSNSDQTDAAVARLQGIAANQDLPEIYRHIASFKALTLQNDGLSAAERRTGFEALANPGAPLRLLAEEQLALIDISQGQSAAAIERLQAILQDAEVSRDLQQRAAQVIVALGGTPQSLPGTLAAPDSRG